MVSWPPPPHWQHLATVFSLNGRVSRFSWRALPQGNPKCKIKGKYLNAVKSNRVRTYVLVVSALMIRRRMVAAHLFYQSPFYTVSKIKLKANQNENETRNVTGEATSALHVRGPPDFVCVFVFFLMHVYADTTLSANVCTIFLVNKSPTFWMKDGQTFLTKNSQTVCR